jgi:predicted MFS family arabinose efflux permease
MSGGNETAGQGGAERLHEPSSPFVWGFAISQLAGWGVIYFAFSLFVGPMEAELGWSRTDLNGALTAGLLTTAFASLPVGFLIDRYGGYVLMSVGAIAAAALIALWSLIDNLLAFYLLWIGIGLAQAATMGDQVYAVLIQNVRNYRQAFTYVAFITGLSSTVFLPIISLLIEGLGWRPALVALAAIYLVAAAGPNLYFLRGTKGARPAPIREEKKAAGPSPLLAAIRRRAFWALVICFGIQTFAFSGLTYHIIPLLQERGLGLDAIVAALAIIGPAQVSGRLVLHFFGQRASMRNLGRVMAPVLPFALLLLLVAPNFGFAGLALYAIVSGVTNGLIIIVRAVGLAEILGTRGFGQISGAMMFIIQMPRTAAPLVFAALWQSFGGYDPVIWILIGATAVGAVAFWIAAAEPPPAEA